jgi:hypothetical protein
MKIIAFFQLNNLKFNTVVITIFQLITNLPNRIRIEIFNRSIKFEFEYGSANSQKAGKLKDLALRVKDRDER